MNTTPLTADSTSTTRKSSQTGRSVFTATHWSVVMTAGRGEAPGAREALEKICRRYWYPLYAYVRRRGYAPEDAKDLTQEFFARLLDRDAMATVRPEKGRFRSFLLASLNHFLADEWDKVRAQKRGGGRVIALDLQSAETRLGEASENDTPEKAFERRWAVALLEQVYQRLAEEHRREGRMEGFEVLRATLAGKSASAPYRELARRLGTSEGAVKVAVHRLRQRYRELLRELIAETVSSPEEVQDELRYLFRALAGR